MEGMIPIARPAISEVEIEAATRVLRSGKFVMGEEVAEFEDEFARHHGGTQYGYGVAVSSGTAALTLLLKAHGINKNDEVVLPSFTFFATAEAVVACGAKPVFVDIEPDSFCIDPKAVERAITGKTAAIIAVHLFGRICKMSELFDIARRHTCKLFEDACQAHGAHTVTGLQRVGGLADGSAFSFYPSKNMTTLEGGMVLTKSETIYDKLCMLRNHGVRPGTIYDHKLCSGNFKMTELQAAIGRVQLKKLDAANTQRRANAAAYTEYIKKNIPRVTPPEHVNGHVYNQYTVRVDAKVRDDLVRALNEQGIGVRVYYPKPVHRQEAFQSEVQPDLPETERASREVLSLPVHPGVTVEDRDRILHALQALT
jgi:dTDP-4-amino-4,6-dideoxygalactose transaminase